MRKTGRASFWWGVSAFERFDSVLLITIRPENVRICSKGAERIASTAGVFESWLELEVRKRTTRRVRL